VGWLDHLHPYRKGAVAPHLIEKMKALAAKPVHLFRGSHICELCPPEITSVPVEKSDPRFPLSRRRIGSEIGLFCPKACQGNGEIRIRARDLFSAGGPQTGKALAPAEIGPEPNLIFVKQTIFAAPVLIVHYIKAHGYLPPMEFLNALEMHRME